MRPSTKQVTTTKLSYYNVHNHLSHVYKVCHAFQCLQLIIYLALQRLASHTDVLRLVTRFSSREGTRDEPKNVCVEGYPKMGPLNSLHARSC